MKKFLFLIICLLNFTWVLADDSGTLEGGLTYNFVSSTGTLTISGNGAMVADTDSDGDWWYPWNFYRSDIKSVRITQGVTEISYEAFYYCTNLLSVELPSTLTRIYDGAFSHCSSLTSVSIPSSVTTIEGGAFQDCSNLTSVSIPSSVKTIQVCAFSGCSSLTLASLPAGLTYIGSAAFSDVKISALNINENVRYIGSRAFGSQLLTSITVDEDNPYYSDGNGSNCIITKSNNSLILGCRTTRIPYGVASIGESAFSNCSNLSSITIPSSVNTIDRYAFEYCTSLSSINIPSSVKTINNNAFQGCTSLSSVNIPNGVTSIAASLFEGCTSLSSVNIPNGVKQISQNAFRGCSSLNNISIPESVTGIYSMAFAEMGDLNITMPNIEWWADVFVYFDEEDYPSEYAFEGTSCRLFWTDEDDEITEITIPSNVTKLRNKLFGGFNNIKSVNFHADINTVGYFPFSSGTRIVVPKGTMEKYQGFYNLSNCNIVEEGFFIINNVLYVIDKDTKTATIIGVDDDDFILLSSIKVGNTRYNVTSIENKAFYGNNNITDIDIPEGVKNIGNQAFGGCSSLVSVTIPESVISIGNDAFTRCTGLKKVIVPDISAWCSISFGNFYSNPLYYAHHIYSDENTEIKNLIIPEDVVKIGSNAFDNCYGLTSVTIPESVTSIGSRAFYYCYGLTSVTIPESVTSIGNDAFYNCSRLQKVIVPDITAWCGISFGNSYSNPLYYAHHIYSDENTEIKNLVIPEDVVKIASNAFYGCSDLTSVTIPEGVTNIGSYAFSDCMGLTSISIPESVTSLGRSAFQKCTALFSVELKSNTLVSANRSSSSSFLSIFGQQVKEYILGSAITSIGSYAFYECNSLHSIEIPNSVTSIDSYAFYECNSLQSIEIPNSVTSIDSYAFYECNSLQSIEIPNSVTTIGGSAFSRCTGLTSVTIPNSVTSIGDYAFYSCSRLVNVTVENPSPVTITSNAFSNRTNATLIVPDGARNAYKAANYWKEFKNIGEITGTKNTLEISDIIVDHGANVTLPVIMTNLEKITAAEFELSLPSGVRLLDCELTDRQTNHDIQYSLKDNGNYQIVIWSISSSSFTGNEGALLNLKLGTDAEGEYTVTIKNIELTSKDNLAIRPIDSSADLNICDIPLGDTNGDGRITISDAVAIVNYKLDRPSKYFVAGAADVNTDNTISITDAVIIVNWILYDNTGATVKRRNINTVDSLNPQ